MNKNLNFYVPILLSTLFGFGFIAGYGLQIIKINNLKREINNLKTEINNLKTENLELIKQIFYSNEDFSDYSE